jgi:hypothetical protein
MPLLADAQRRRPDVAFAFANQGEDAPTAQRYLADSGLALDHVLLDPGRRSARRPARARCRSRCSTRPTGAWSTPTSAR